MPLKNMIMVDIQPTMSKYMGFSLRDMSKFVSQANSVLCLYNSDDTEVDVIDMMIHAGFAEGFIEDSFDFIAKDQGFFRAMIDAGYSNELILKVIRYMASQDHTDSREITTWSDLDFMDRHLVNILRNIGVFIPRFMEKDYLYQYQGAHVIGGHETECLRETLVWFDFLDFPYRVHKPFVY